MILELDEQTLKDICNNASRTLVGKICKRLELLQLQNIPQSNKDALVKELMKEHVYENYRDLLFSCLSSSKNVQAFRIEYTKSKEIK